MKDNDVEGKNSHRKFAEMQIFITKLHFFYIHLNVRGVSQVVQYQVK